MTVIKLLLNHDLRGFIFQQNKLLALFSERCPRLKTSYSIYVAP